MKIDNLKSYVGFGIAGNFANHLDQAGEAKNFVNVIVEEKNAPKGLFPFYQPIHNDTFLNTFPLSSNKIVLPNLNNAKVQMEPEVALICEIKYSKKNKVKNIKIKSFTAYNDCSVREPNAPKISQKKNWGENSKGISEQTIKIDKFELESTMDNFHIASFLKNNGTLQHYGEDSSVLTYNYFYKKLKTWIIEKLNTQEDFGPLENLSEILEQSNYTKEIIISIGATSYTKYGETKFLEEGDEVYVVVYDNTKYTIEEIEQHLKKDNLNLKDASILHQYILNNDGLYFDNENSRRLYKKYKHYENDNLHMLNYCFESKLHDILSNTTYEIQVQKYLTQEKNNKHRIICNFDCLDEEIFNKYTQEEFVKKIILNCLSYYKADVSEYIELDDDY